MKFIKWNIKEKEEEEEEEEKEEKEANKSGRQTYERWSILIDL